MPLHGRHSSRTASIAEPVFAAGDTRKSLPAHRFPDAEARSQDVFQLIRDELLLDGNARQNLATFCQTWEEPEVHRLMELAIDKNIIDKDEYPQSAEIEGRCVRLLADLWNAPDTADSIGTSTIGSSEACMLGGIAALWRWRAQRRAAGKPVDKPNMVCGPVQICWHKFARYWDVELREVPMEPRHLCLGPAEVASRVDENTIVVVPTFGVTYTGQYEPVAEIAGALDDVHARRGLDVPLHVDAASGGFLAPFCAPEVVFDFRLPRVKSISTSGHKFGLAPLGVGWIVWRTFSDLPRELIFSVDYLGGDMPTFALNFSRPAGQVIAQYYNFVRLGRAGDRAVHEACYATAHYLADAIAELGPFDVIANGDPKTSIPAVCWKLRDSVIPGYTLYDLADRLRVRGWQVPAYPLAGNAAHIVVQRILVRQGLSRDLASLLLDDLRSAIGHFGKHPVSVPMSAKESGGFKHT